MHIEGIHHISVVVTDLEQSKQFYSEVLGLKESADRPAFDFPGAWYEAGAMQIHLIVHEPSLTRRGTSEINTRDGHFALRVRDMEEVLAQLERCGIVYKNKPDSITGWHQVFITDPDGNIIEFNAPGRKA
jgi:glyoxylase I family protein